MINYMTATAATLQTSSSTITVTGESVDFSKIDDNYVVLLDNGLYVMPVLSGSSFDGSGNSTLTLTEPWQGAPLTNKKLLVLPVFAKVYESVAAMTALNDVTRGILLKLEDLLTATSPTLDVRVGTSATISTVPYGYLADQVQANIDSLNALDLITADDVVQTTGTSTTDLMSQKATTDNIDALAGSLNDLENSLGTAAESTVVQTTGTSTTNIMSQKATTDTVTLSEREAMRMSVEAVSSGKNTVIWDDQGNPNVMVWINQFNCEDVNAAILARHGWDPQLGTGVFPAFINNGSIIRGFWYGKYAASDGGNGGCSVVSGASPKRAIDYDTAKALCTNKGVGWHLAANIEWMAIAYLAIAFGEQPRGDTFYGQAHDARYETAKRSVAGYAAGDSGLLAPSLTGTGSKTWSHDGTRFGVFDLVGSVWEWLDQLKLKEGQIFAPSDNNPDLAEASWPSHECFLDSSITTPVSTILNSKIANSTGDGYSDTWSEMASDASYVKTVLMRQLGVEPASPDSFSGVLTSLNLGERLPLRGGHWYNGPNAGLCALYFGGARTGANSTFSFRPALF
jgi:hypothetical protein